MFSASKLLKKFDKSLPKWLRSRLVESTTVLNRNDPFDIECGCGTKSTVVRFDRYQQVICLECGEALFVLPKNPYPEPPPTDPAKAQKKTTSVAVIDDETAVDGDTELLDDGFVDDQQLKPLPQTREEREAAKKEATESKSGVAEKKPAPAPPPDQIALGKIKRPREKLLTPFRIVLLGIGAVLLGTGYFVLRSRQAADAEVALHDSSEAATLAVEENRIDDARQQFETAAAAANTLGLSSEYARFDSLAKQCDVIGRLSDTSLYECLTNAEQVFASGGTSWLDDLTTKLADNWFVFDAAVARRGDSFVVSMPILLNAATLELDVKSEQLGRLNLSTKPRRVIFAGQCASFRRDNSANRWVIGLKADSAILWTSEPLYEQAVMELTEDPWDLQTVEILRTQRQLAESAAP